jgi:hypothetical protein
MMELPRARTACFSTLTILAIAACLPRWHQSPVESPRGPERVAVVTSNPENAHPSAGTIPIAEPNEPVVDLEMADAPVRLILQRLAEIGGLQLIMSPNLDKTLSVQYVHVPVSVALNDVLKRAGLRLGAGPAANLPFDTVTVFYQLPANVDSMSADAIVRRYGVSKAVAELIVKSRRPLFY